MPSVQMLCTCCGNFCMHACIGSCSPACSLLLLCCERHAANCNPPRNLLNGTAVLAGVLHHAVDVPLGRPLARLAVVQGGESSIAPHIPSNCNSACNNPGPQVEDCLQATRSIYAIIRTTYNLCTVVRMSPLMSVCVMCAQKAGCVPCLCQAKFDASWMPCAVYHELHVCAHLQLSFSREEH
jgi:hypothetical protein